jgi:hypothetical protein
MFSRTLPRAKQWSFHTPRRTWEKVRAIYKGAGWKPD